MIELALARHETISVPHPIQMRLHPLGVSHSAGLQSSSDHADLYGDGTCGSKSHVLCAAPHVHNDRRTKIGRLSWRSTPISDVATGPIRGRSFERWFQRDFRPATPTER